MAGTVLATPSPGMQPNADQLLLADVSVAELLADAYKQEFSGSLIFEDDRGSLSAIRCHEQDYPSSHCGLPDSPQYCA